MTPKEYLIEMFEDLLKAGAITQETMDEVREELKEDE